MLVFFAYFIWDVETKPSVSSMILAKFFLLFFGHCNISLEINISRLQKKEVHPIFHATFFKITKYL